MNEINIENNLSVENNNNNIDNDIENNIDNDIEDNIYNNIENNNSLYNNYNTKIKKDVLNAFDLANKAKLNGIDGENFVSIEKTNNLIERVIGLLTVFEPRLIDEEIRKKIKEDLIEFEKKYSKSDWRVGMEMAFLFATNNYIKFDNEKDAIDLGVRFGFAYLTSGVVSSPIEGYIGLDIRKTRNGKEYFALKYAGPIRNAGGTAASVSVLIADYLRKKLNYAKYDPTQEEVERTIVELNNYHDRVSNLQYLPSDRETEFFFKNLPVQIDGDPTSELEVSNFKNIPRINTNRIRGGFCLVCSECLQLKAQKIKKKLDDWGKEMNLDDWDFLKEYLEIQKQMKTKSVDSKINSKEEIKEETNIKIKENYSYLKEISAGKPVFSYPMKEGFRIRYGRTRLSGYSCSGLNPISMKILDDFIGYGTQIKTERPFKGATITPCDSIEGPIVKLKNGYVVKIKSLEEFKKYSKEISKILHVGDILVNFGDFYNRNHNIIPSGYVEEWWIQDLLYKLIDLKLINLKKIGINDINQDNKMIISRIIKKGDIAYFLNLDLMSKEINIPKENLELIFNEYLTYEISFMDSLVISLKYNIPMHPKHLFFISNINIYEYEKLIEKLKNIGFFFKKIKDKSNFKDDLEKDLKNDVKNFYDSINKLVIENEDLSIEKPVKEEKIKIKELFEKMLIPHSFIDNKIILEADVAKAFIFSFIKIKDNEIEEFMKSEMYVVTDDFISENNYSKEFPKLFFYETKISTENVIGELNKRFEVPLIKNKNSIYMGLRLGRPEKAKPREIKGGYNGLFTLGDFKNENLKNNSKEYLYLNSKIYSQKFYCESCEIYSPLSSCVFCGKSLEPISFDSNWSDKKK